MSQSADRLRKFMQHPDTPELLSQDIKTLFSENDSAERLKGMVSYFAANNIDMVLHLHTNLPISHWTCMLWGMKSAYGEGETPLLAMDLAIIRLKRPSGDQEGL